MAKSYTYLRDKLSRKLIEQLSETDAELADLKHKYERLINFTKYISEQGCELERDCRACYAIHTLRKMDAL